MISVGKRDKIIAAAVTTIVVALILLFLFFTSINSDRNLLAEASIPEPEEEITFLETELMEELPGNDEPSADQAEELPQPQGEPDPAAAEQPERVERGEKPKKEAPTEPVASQKKESPAKVKENSISEAESKRIAGIKGRFNKNNGSPDGKRNASAGKGKVNSSGSIAGRRFLGCTTGEVSVRTTIKVRVNVRVNAAGNVQKATAVSGPEEYKSVCEKWARTARWDAKEGAPVASGSITFTISPK